VLAPDVGSGELELMAKEITEKESGLDRALVAPAVDGDGDFDHPGSGRRNRNVFRG
jgi:hypothetical protein